MPNLATTTTWNIIQNLSSDYNTHIIAHQYNKPLMKTEKTFTKYNKADWTKFTQDIETAAETFHIPNNFMATFPHYCGLEGVT